VSGFGGMEKGMTGSSVASDCVLMYGKIGGDFLPGVLDVLGQHSGDPPLVWEASASTGGVGPGSPADHLTSSLALAAA
jgi:hypothetical protein